MNRVTVWACADTAAQLPDKPWLTKLSPAWTEGGVVKRVLGQQFLLGREMAQRINSAVVINPINLFAMAIVPSPRQALDERGLAQQIDWLKTIASRLPYSPDAVLTADDPAMAIAQALKLGFAARVAHPLGDIIAVPDKEVSAVNYLRNNVLHAYALPALVADHPLATMAPGDVFVIETPSGGGYGPAPR